jgi:hypothetical protein
MKYTSGYTKKSELYFVTIFEGGQAVTIHFQSFEELNGFIVKLDNASNLTVDNAK